MSKSLLPQVSRLTAILKKLGDNDLTNKKDFKHWFEAIPTGLENYSVSGAPPEINVDQSRLCLGTLEELTNILRDAVEDACMIRETVSARLSNEPPSEEKGLLSLPDETLSNVFMYLKDDEFGPLRVSQINQRIRNVAVSTSTLWSALHTIHQLQLLELFLARANAVDLTIYISKYRDKKIPEDIRDLLVKESFRWKVVYIELINTRCTLWDAMDEYGALNLPNLVLLSTRFNQCIIREGSDVDFYRPEVPKRTMPSLKHIGGHSLHAILAWGQTIRSCEVEHIAPSSVISGISSCLNNLPLCQTLKMIFPYISRSSDDAPYHARYSAESRDYSGNSLHNLRSLILCASELDYMSIVCPLVKRRIPTNLLHEFTLEFIAGNSNRGRSFKEPTLALSFNQLMTLNVIFRKNQEFKIRISAVSMPNLEHIDITACNTEPTERFSKLSTEQSLPPFKTITFRNCCWSLDHKYLIDLAETVARDTKGFRRLAFYDCIISDRAKYLLKMALPGRLEWTENNHRTIS